MKIAKSLTELVGRTPLLELGRIERHFGLQSRLLAKIEAFNPSGSVKDRVALRMIENAEQMGELHADSVIIEPTSGNTGVGLAWVGRARGYRVILTMPETMSLERRQLLQAYGAELVLTPGPLGMAGAIERAEELRRATPHAVILNQFNNPANPDAHFRTTAREIWDDTEGSIDAFVAGVGTGGTITGVGRKLKQLNSAIEIVAVEPAESAVLSGGKPGPHTIQGIGAGFVPANYDSGVVDRIIAISGAEAAENMRLLAGLEGLLTGISSGAALTAALRLASEPVYAGKTIVALLPDTGTRYLSTDILS